MSHRTPRIPGLLWIAAMLLLAAAPASAQVFRSVASDGSVSYSDVPPPGPAPRPRSAPTEKAPAFAPAAAPVSTSGLAPDLNATRRAAEQGDAKSQYNLGLMYDKGVGGVAQNDAEAIKWYRKAAEQGDAKGETNLGMMYADGRGVTRDYAEAVKWYRKAAEQGDEIAQMALGQFYTKGQGVAKSEAEAEKWLRKAAERGGARVENAIGNMYESGNGMPKDYAQAVKWYRMAAEHGNALAQFALGNMYEIGRGVPKDDAESKKWYRMAAQRHDAGAEALLRKLAGQGDEDARRVIRALAAANAPPSAPAAVVVNPPAATAEQQDWYAFGQYSLHIPKPDGFVPTAAIVPDALRSAQAGDPVDRIVELYATTDDAKVLAAGKRADQKRYLGLAVERKLDGVAISESRFQNVSKEFENEAATAPGWDYLGVYRREPWGVFVTSKVRSTKKGVSKANVFSRAVVWINNRQALLLLAEAQSSDESDVKWTQQVLSAWADAIHKASQK